MARYRASITLTRAGGFPQVLELGPGNTVTVGGGVITVKKITADGATLSYERDGATPIEIVLSGEKPHSLTVEKTPLATLAFVSVTAQE